MTQSSNFLNKRIFSSDLTKKDRVKLVRPYRQWFSQRLKQAQAERGLTNPKFMEALGISATQLAKYRRGDNWGDILQVARMAYILNKPFNYFIHPDFRGAIENEEVERFLKIYDAGRAAAKENRSPTIGSHAHNRISAA